MYPKLFSFSFPDARSFKTYAQNVIDVFSLPPHSSVACLHLTIKDLTTLVWLAWDHLVRTSYSLALEHYQISLVWDIPSIDSVLNKFLPGMEQPYLVEIMNLQEPCYPRFFWEFSYTTMVHSRNLPQQNHISFEVYAQIDSFLHVQITTKQNLVCPNIMINRK